MTVVPDLAEFLSIAQAGVRFPVVSEQPLGDLTPVELYRRIRAGSCGVILESGKHHRHSYVASEIERVFTSRGTWCELAGAELEQTTGDPFQQLRRILGRHSARSHPLLRKFNGGAVGYFSYDMARHIERIPDTAIDDLELPESCFLLVDRFYEIDHEAKVVRIVVAPVLTTAPLDEQFASLVGILREMKHALETAPQAPNRKLSPPSRENEHHCASVSPDEFADMVRRAKSYIGAGDIFQVNLSVRFDLPFPDDPLDLYRTLGAINPSPYMSFMEVPGLAIASASPELLLSVDGRTIETRPIAGTRPRGAGDAEDQANAIELIENEKERAEHLMMVDMERNDIGRVARYGSVEVNELMAIEKYSHVIHIVSNVRGVLAEGRDTFDAIRACFPGGTITGAPKVRSMEIIDELERYRRGIYTGSIGWLGYDGNATLNIAIRTIVVSGGRAYVQAGAGIVADSVPELEYAESARKAEAALQAVRRTGLWDF